jgi:hypothetical protein
MTRLTHSQWYADLRRAVTATGGNELTRAQVERLDVPGALDLFAGLGTEVATVESFLSLARSLAPRGAARTTDFRVGLAELSRRTPTSARPSLATQLEPMTAAAKQLSAEYAGWGLAGEAVPVAIRAFPNAGSLEDVRRTIEQSRGFASGWSVSDAMIYSGIPQNPAGLWRATTLYLKYYLLEDQGRPLTEAKKVQEFERSIEAALDAMAPKSMTAISTLFTRSGGGSTEAMALAVETQDGKWFAIEGPHHHPWGGHIHDVWTPPAGVR